MNSLGSVSVRIKIKASHSMQVITHFIFVPHTLLSEKNRSNQTQPLFDELAQNPFVFVNRVGEIFASSSKEIEAIQKLISQVGLVFVDQTEKIWISNAGGASSSRLIRMSWARVCNICKSSQSALTAKGHKKETCLRKMMILLWWRFLKKHWQ